MRTDIDVDRRMYRSALTRLATWWTGQHPTLETPLQAVLLKWMEPRPYQAILYRDPRSTRPVAKLTPRAFVPCKHAAWGDDLCGQCGNCDWCGCICDVRNTP